MNEKLELETKGLRKSMSKTETTVYDFSEINRQINGTRHVIKMRDNVVCEVKLKYFGLAVQNNGRFEEDVKNRIMYGWIDVSGEKYPVFCATRECS